MENDEQQKRGNRQADHLPKQKASLRKEALRRRDAMDSQARVQISERICDLLSAELPEANETSVVAVYSSMGSEVDLSRFIDFLYLRGATVAFPCMNKKGTAPRMHMRKVEQCAWKSRSVPFIENPIKRFDLDTPELESFEIVPPDDISAIIVPMVAFDGSFRRLGYGGGNYDEYLSLIPRETRIIGVAFETQRLPFIATEKHDLSLPLIISA